MSTGRPSPRVAGGGLRLIVVLGLLCGGVPARGANFPPLPGLIVDQANVIPADTRAAIEPKLVDLEAKSGIQLVVATVTSLEGQEIEPYANALFPDWTIAETA